jgi:hypothetical protein
MPGPCILCGKFIETVSYLCTKHGDDWQSYNHPGDDWQSYNHPQANVDEEWDDFILSHPDFNPEVGPVLTIRCAIMSLNENFPKTYVRHW